MAALFALVLVGIMASPVIGVPQHVANRTAFAFMLGAFAYAGNPAAVFVILVVGTLMYTEVLK